MLMKYLLGVFCIIVASFAFAVIGILGTMIENHIHCMVMVFFQNIITLCLFLPWFLSKGVNDLKSRCYNTHLLRAICGVMASFLLYFSLRQLDLYDVVLLENSSPLIIPLIAMLVLKERISWMVWLSLSIGFTGIYFVILPPDGVDIEWRLIWPLGAAFFVACSFVLVKTIDWRESLKSTLFYYFLFSTFLSFPFILLHPVISFHRNTWVCLIGVGLAMAIAQGFLVLGYRFSEAGKLAPFSYFEVVFGLILGRFFLHLPLTSHALGGSVFVFLSGLFMILFERRIRAME